MKKCIYLLVSIVLLLGVANFSSAAEDKFVKECGPNQVIFSTGVKGNTYSDAIQPVKTLAPDVICERTDSSGGARNVELLTGLGGDAEAAIVPADVLEYMSRTNPEVKKLRAILSLWGNSLHIIASTTGYKVEKKGKYFGSTTETEYIQDFRDLRGKKIAVFGSPVISVRMIDERLKMDFDIVDASGFKDGLARLDKGEVQAFMIMGGYPVNNIEQLDRTKYMLVNVDPATVASLGAPYYATKINYPMIGANGFTAITAKNMVMVRDYKSQKWIQRYGALYHAIKDNLQDLQEMRGAHPVWKIVNNVDELDGTTPYEYLKQFSQTVAVPENSEAVSAEPVVKTADEAVSEKIKRIPARSKKR